MKAVLIRMTDEMHKKLRQRSVDTDKTVTAIMLEATNKIFEPLDKAAVSVVEKR